MAEKMQSYDRQDWVPELENRGEDYVPESNSGYDGETDPRPEEEL